MKCAWCNPEDHVGTHGICDKHAAQVLQQHRERRAAKRRQEQREQQALQQERKERYVV